MNRSPSILVALALLLALGAAGSAAAEIYRWVDEHGEPHLVGNLWEVPQAYRAQAAEDAKARAGGSVNIVDEAGGTDPGTASAPAKMESAPAAPASPGGHSESWWRAEANTRQRAIEDAESALADAQAEEADDAGQIYARPGRHRPRAAGRAAVLSAASDSNDYDDEPSVADLETSVTRAQRDLDDFEEQARRAGVPPGWLR